MAVSASAIDNAQRTLMMRGVSYGSRGGEALAVVPLPYERVKIDGTDYFDTASTARGLMAAGMSLKEKRGTIVGMEVIESTAMIALPHGKYPVFSLGNV